LERFLWSISDGDNRASGGVSAIQADVLEFGAFGWMKLD
jgi:hypothetical protein